MRFLEHLNELKKSAPWIRAACLYGDWVWQLPGAPRNDPSLIVACQLLETEAAYLRAWPILLGISMALGEIPETFFEVLTGDQDLGKLYYQLYPARSEFYREARRYLLRQTLSAEAHARG